MDFQRYGHATHRMRTEDVEPHLSDHGSLDLAHPSQLASFMLSLIGAGHGHAVAEPALPVDGAKPGDVRVAFVPNR